MKRILFANIGWMTHYQGYSQMDKITGGGSYDDRDKHESYNFQNLNGKNYGFVQTVRNGSIDLRRIDPAICKDSEYIDHVLVVWTALRPGKGGTYIVGWYDDAIVYRYYQEKRSDKRKNYGYNIVASTENCHLLTPDNRLFEVPRARNGLNRGFMGQSNVWFADKPYDEVIQFRKAVVDYVKSSGKATFKKRRPKINVKAKERVEKAAVAKVMREYENKGYEVLSVEKDNKGWDLEATRGKIRLRIEVKGLAGEEISVHITPNEYKHMRAKDNSDYRLCVVTSALKDPLLYTFGFDHGSWVCQEDPDLSLSFEKVIAAIAKA